MSSKFLERLDEIREGSPPPLGFGPARASKTPGLALIIAVGGEKDGAAAAGAMAPDAVIVSGTDAAQAGEIGEAASGARWGVRADGLTTADAMGWREAGADLIVFSLAGTELAAVTPKDTARVLIVEAGTPSEDLRDIGPLPVDAVLVSMPGEPDSWTLEDLSAVSRVSGRVGKHVLAEVDGAPGGETLEALRNAGVIGLVIGLSAGEDAIKGLQESLLNMPRPGSDRSRSRRRTSAILPGSVYAARRPAPAEDDDDDDD